jgi:small ligand-binding sensory domain FIST
MVRCAAHLVAASVTGLPMTARFASAISEHPDGAQAIGEAVGQILDEIGPSPELAVLFATSPHTNAMAEMAAVVRATLGPTHLLGSTAVSIVGGRREVEDRPAVTLWAGRLAGHITPVQLNASRSAEGFRINGMPDQRGGDGGSLLLLADPFSFPVDDFLAQTAVSHPRLRVFGGLASAARQPGGNRLACDDFVVNSGAVGVFLDEGVVATTVVSQGCRPIGAPFTVTRVDGNMLLELGGKPALTRLIEILEAGSAEDRLLAERGLHCGIVVDESKLDYRRGDFLIRSVLGADPQAGGVAIGDLVAVGATVQFQVRDAASADEDLRELLTGEQAAAALLFTCNGRGEQLFGEPHHDADVVGAMLDTRAVGGMFCAGELGPIGRRNALHGFTASVALFR